MTWINKFEVKFAGTLQWTGDAWENCLAKRRGEKKRVSMLLESLVRPINSCTSEQSRDIQEVILLIHHCKTTYCCRMTIQSTSSTSGTLTRRTPLSKVDWSQEETASEGTDSQCSSQPWTRWMLDKIWKKLNTIWTNPESHRKNIFGKLTTIQDTSAIWSLPRERDRSSVELDRTQPLFQALCHRLEERKWYAWKLVKNKTARYISHPGYFALHLCRTRNTVGRIYLLQIRNSPMIVRAKSMSSGRFVAVVV